MNTLERTRPRRLIPSVSPRLELAIEIAAVLASPAVLYFVLQVRGMAPPQLPDPSMHTTFIVAPHEIFTRYAAVFTPTARLREAARVGFLVPARLSYLMFGALPGFYVFRYVLVIVAIGPAYLLGRSLHGRWAGFLAIVVIVSSPVLITAWGTDYPDSAAVSYLTGAVATLALTLRPGYGGPAWVALTGTLLTLAIWSHGIAVPLGAVAILVYAGVRATGDRLKLARDAGLLLGAAVTVTGLLAIGSKLLIGPLDFIGPTLRAERFLSTPAQELLWHSSSWRWAFYDPYLLVPPAVVAAFVAVFARRAPRIGPAELFVGASCGLQLLLLAYLQFAGHVQGLEMHYLSSALWATVNLTLVLVLAEIAAPLAISARAAPALLVLAVAVAYAVLEPGVPAMTWAPWGAAVAILVAGAALLGRRPLAWSARVLSAASVVLVTGGTLALTVAPGEAHARLAHTVYDPPPAYASALGGSEDYAVDQYAVAAELPAFVGHPAYRGEQLLTWWPWYDATPVVEPMGIYHSSFNAVSWTFPRLDATGLRKIESRRAAQVLLMSLTGHHFDTALRSLSAFEPAVIRRTVLSHGSYHLHLWLIDLRRYLRPPHGTGTS